MDNSTDLYGITRIDHKNTHSWWVRLKYINRKPQIQKSFADLKHGGRSQAFTLAVSYRDKQMALHNISSSARPLSWKNRTRKEWKLKKCIFVSFVEKGILLNIKKICTTVQL